MSTKRPHNSVYMGNFAAPALASPRIAFIGLGRRAQHLLYLLTEIGGCDVVGLCELVENRAQEAAEILTSKGLPAPALYAESREGHARMLAELKPDAVFITVGWQLHAKFCIDAMEAGAHAFVEVPLATSISELWQIVDTAERTQRHCMMLENACYSREELLFLNMVQQGIIGEPLHAEAAYIHDLRFIMTDENRNEADWRVKHYMKRNGNLYPTHGIGPVAQYMGIGRGVDQFSHLVSMSSRAVNFSRYTQEHFAADHPWNEEPFHCGDVNTSIIQTMQGNTILLQWDECSLRPYTRHNLIQGSKGILAGFPTRVISEALGSPMHSDWISGDALEPIYERFEHPLWKRLGAKGTELAGARA